MHEDLVEACKKKDRKAQLELYNLYAQGMYTVCLNMINNESIAEDLMQEAMISAFSKLNTFIGEVSFGAWLKRITVNKCIDYLKQKKLGFDSLDENESFPVEDENADDSDIIKHKFELILLKMKELPSGYRTILNLYLLEGYDHEEIASILGVTSSTSRSQYTRAKALLLKKLNTV